MLERPGTAPYIHPVSVSRSKISRHQGRNLLTDLRISIPCLGPPGREAEEAAMMRFRSGSWSIPQALLFALCLSLSSTWLVGQETEKKETAKAEEMAPPQPQKPTADQVAAAKAREDGSSRPPKTGKMVGNHWTPYAPPDPE